MESVLIEKVNSSPIRLQTVASLDSWFNKSPSSITYCISSNTQLKCPSLHSKLWWTLNLSELRQLFYNTTQAQKLGTTTQLQMFATRNFYFKAIKAAKSKQWTQFLANVDAQSVWTAKRFAYGRAPDRFSSFPSAISPSAINSALLNYFFLARCPSTGSPVVPIYSSALPVSAEEIVDTVRKSSNTSAPGPDSILYGI